MNISEKSSPNKIDPSYTLPDFLCVAWKIKQHSIKGTGSRFKKKTIKNNNNNNNNNNNTQVPVSNV
jgi:hypothetical protein